MQTRFSAAQLEDPDTREAEKILRSCVHCGFCTATCPTYVLLGDELDSPRGRIYLLKDMLESGRAPDSETVRHLDRCLSCLSCMTTCPSGVNYMHLIDQGRALVEQQYRRPFLDRALRAMLSFVLQRRPVLRLALIGGWFARLFSRPVARYLPRRIEALLALVPAVLPSPGAAERPGTHPAEGARRARVALLPGCVQPVMAPQIDAATLRLLARHGVEAVMPDAGALGGCCGSLPHHMGREHEALEKARRMVDLWWAQTTQGGGQGLDAILMTASGCGTTVKDYGYMLREDQAYAGKAAAIAALAKDVSEFMTTLGIAPLAGQLPEGLKVTYHSACSMQHGQKLKTEPQALLRQAGFAVSDVPEGHLCCGSAGTYNILQPDIAGALKKRKLANIATTRPQIIATGNVGCMAQLADGAPAPVVHTVELLDWATGGPRPAALG
jgi:glycolate oxidase iron-sulfur subunit